MSDFFSLIRNTNESLKASVVSTVNETSAEIDETNAKVNKTSAEITTLRHELSEEVSQVED